MSPTLVLAHQGGWDEMLLVLVPIAVIAALLGIAKRRIDRRGGPDAPDHLTSPTHPDPDRDRP